MAPPSQAAFELQDEVRDLHRLLDAAQATDDGNGEDSEYGRELWRLRSVATVLAAFVEQRSDSGWAKDPDASSSYVDRIGVIDRIALEVPVKNLQNELGRLLRSRVSDRDLQQLIEIRILLAQALGAAIGAAIEQVRTAADDTTDLDFLSSLVVRLAGPLAREVLTDAAAVSKARTAQQETAGAVAESELAKEFADYGDRQARAGQRWLVAAIGLFAATVVVALTVLQQVDQVLNWYSLASHLLIALPCLGFGAYCTRESSRHRELAQWARRIAVQLKSVGAYTARLDDAARLALLGQFGSYVFGPHQLGTEDNQVQPIPQELWKALADVIRGRGTGQA
jgi:hypothetical protein